MMQEADFQKFVVDLRHVESPKFGLTRLDVAKTTALPRLIRTSESSVKPMYRHLKRDSNIIFAIGSLLGLCRKSGLVRLLTSEWSEFEGIVGFCESNLDPDVTVCWSRGCVVLKIEGLRPESRGQKVYAVDFNSFSMDETIGGFFLGVIKYVQDSRATIAFSCMSEDPISTNDLSLDSHSDIRV